MAETTVYLHVDPEWSDWQRDANGEWVLAGIKVTKVAQRRPTRIQGAVVKLRLRIPDGAFKPLRPAVTVEVPEAALSYEPEVTVELPDGSSDG